MKDDRQAPKQPKEKVRSLPIQLWPAADRRAWEGACWSGARLKRGGAASHLKPVTQIDLAKRYGLYFDFLSRSDWLDLSAGAGEHVTPHHIEVYVAELKQRVSSVTVYGSIHKLRRTVQLIAPDRDLRWLIEIERDLASEMQPQSKWDRIVLTEVLIEAGLTLIAEGESADGLTRLTRARLVRNGLMVALLADRPIRLKNFAALEIGRSIVNVNGTWWIVLTASETKEGRPDERPVTDYIGEAINTYLQTYRPILARRDGNVPSALWLTLHGNAMSYASMGELITETTRSTVGVNISPHLFRAAGATSAAIHAGDNPHLGAALLHHRHSTRRHNTVTEEHYNRATSMSAAKAYAAITETYRRG
jgi:site-specific recombinase XerD